MHSSATTTVELAARSCSFTGAVHMHVLAVLMLLERSAIHRRLLLSSASMLWLTAMNKRKCVAHEAREQPYWRVKPSPGVHHLGMVSSMSRSPRLRSCKRAITLLQRKLQYSKYSGCQSSCQAVLFRKWVLLRIINDAEHRTCSAYWGRTISSILEHTHALVLRLAQSH